MLVMRRLYCSEKYDDKLAKMHVVKDLLKANYSRPFFVCSDQSNTCSFWIWGDVRPIAKPECRHGFQCVVRKLVKKETINKDRLFCAQQYSCNYFECVHEESFYEFSRPLTKQNEKEQCISFIIDLNSVLEN